MSSNNDEGTYSNIASENTIFKDIYDKINLNSENIVTMYKLIADHINSEPDQVDSKYLYFDEKLGNLTRYIEFIEELIQQMLKNVYIKDSSI